MVLIQELKCRYPSAEILYIGSFQGPEKKLVTDGGIAFCAIFTGKLRRYFSWKNFVDFPKFFLGIFQATWILFRFQPDLIFSKGGYVSLPVALGAFLNRKKLVLHESDVVPGLANKIAAKFSSLICVSFSETTQYFSGKNCVITGNPVRPDLIEGKEKNARIITGFKDSLPVLLIMGGSQGSKKINTFLFEHINEILEKFQLVHLTGKNNLIDTAFLQEKYHLKPQYAQRYYSQEFAQDELKDFYALSDVIISRAGASSLSEISYIQKPALLIPLGTQASRGDQIRNAKVFVQDHLAVITFEDDLRIETFLGTIQTLLQKKQNPWKNYEFPQRKILDHLEKLL